MNDLLASAYPATLQSFSNRAFYWYPSEWALTGEHLIPRAVWERLPMPESQQSQSHRCPYYESVEDAFDALCAALDDPVSNFYFRRLHHLASGN